jgi:hypothetical protein
MEKIARTGIVMSGATTENIPFFVQARRRGERHCIGAADATRPLRIISRAHCRASFANRRPSFAAAVQRRSTGPSLGDRHQVPENLKREIYSA